MEEHVPLESANKKKFDKTVSGIKKLIKSGKLVNKAGKVVKTKFKKSGDERGVVYIGHIPHGFYEDQMRSYFSQFGKVTNVRVARSKRNGRSKGYGFIEFQDREVAEIVAETMNNYLMDKRLLKAECILPERTLPNLFKGSNWTEKDHPGIALRRKTVGHHNKNISDEDWIKSCKNQLYRLSELTNKLKSFGIDFKFTPRDIPEELKNFDPKTISKSSLKKKKKRSKKTKSDTEDPSNTSVTKSPKKEKSMKKVTPLVKPRKVKKGANRPFIGVLAPTSTDTEETPQKNKKVKNNDKVVEPKEDRLHKKKDFGGIKKKKNVTEKIISDDAMKNKLKKILKSDLVKLIQKPQHKNKAGEGEKKRKQK